MFPFYGKMKEKSEKKKKKKRENRKIVGDVVSRRVSFGDWDWDSGRCSSFITQSIERSRKTEDAVVTSPPFFHHLPLHHSERADGGSPGCSLPCSNLPPTSHGSSPPLRPSASPPHPSPPKAPHSHPSLPQQARPFTAQLHLLLLLSSPLLPLPSSPQHPKSFAPRPCFVPQWGLCTGRVAAAREAFRR